MAYKLIYLVENTINGKVYIGKTKTTLKRRISSHLYSVRKGSMTPFHCAIRKYGVDKFEWHEFLVVGESEDLNWYEINTIKLFKDNSYNLHEGGNGGFVVPEHKIEEWRLKLSEARKGGTPFKGHHHSDETKRKCSEASKRRWSKVNAVPT